MLVTGMSFIAGNAHLVSGAEHTALAATPEWTTLPPLSQSAGDGVAFVLNNVLYYVGGWVGSAQSPFNAVHQLNLKPLGTEWNTTNALETPRFGAAATAANGRAYVMGGYDGTTLLMRVDSFDGVSWRSEVAMPQALRFSAATVSQDRLYIAGGVTTNGSFSELVWSAPMDTDGVLGAWRAEGSLPDKLAYTKLAALDTCLYIIGGRVSNANRAEIYRAIWDHSESGVITAWQNAGSLPISLAYHDVAIDQNTLYVLGGETTGGALNDQVYSIGINPDTCDFVGEWASSPMPGGGNRRLSVASRFGELYVLGGQTADGYTNAVWKGVLPVPAATLTLHKSAALDGDFAYSKLITYTLRYANPWPHPDGQTGVVITDTVPANTTWITASGSVTPEAGILRWNIGALSPGANGEAAFTVRVVDAQSASQWELASARRAVWTPENTTWLLQSEIIYTIIYTPTPQSPEVSSGILVTGTLPPQLYPKKGDSIASSVPGSEFALNGHDVIWRVPGIIQQTGYLTVTTCVIEEFSTRMPLTYTIRLQDLVSYTQRVDAQAVAPDIEGTVKPSCTSDTLQLGYKTDVPPLVPTPPDIVVSNTAWICSKELGGCQPSNETVTRYWPVKVFLPLVVKQ